MVAPNKTETEPKEKKTETRIGQERGSGQDPLRKANYMEGEANEGEVNDTAQTHKERDVDTGGIPIKVPPPIPGLSDKEVSEVAKLRKRREQRNQDRLARADEVDREITGESGIALKQESGRRRKRSDSRERKTYLTSDAHEYFGPPIRGPDDAGSPPPWFLPALRKLAATETATPKKSPVIFKQTEEAAHENEQLLKSFDFDIEKLIAAHSDTTLGYGSEFRSVEQLKPLIGRHPNFESLSLVLTMGMPYVFTKELDSVTKLTEMKTLITRGNHKSAKDFPDQVQKLLAKDVLHGFSIPLPVAALHNIPNAAVQPLGLAQQWTLDENGKRLVKFRITQDLSFSSSKQETPVSVNSRIDMDAYPEMIYGWCFPRILHYTVAMRLAYPTFRILIAKYDYSDAYRRMTHSAGAAAQTIAIHKELAYLALRLTYGGAPNPPSWCSFSEIVTDLSNEISQCLDWRPDEIRSPAQPTLPEPKRLPESITIEPGKQMAVAIPIPMEGTVGRVDGFIDDLINVFLDDPHNCALQPHVVPLAMHVTSRPHAGEREEPIARRPILSLSKLEAEGSPAEVQIVLGWRINTRTLSVALPDDKYNAWVEDIQQFLKAGSCTFHEFEQLIGRLNHASFVMPITRHFLGRARALLEPRQHQHAIITLGPPVKDDLTLWKTILANANTGISMNLIVTREPDRICWSDACPFGIGGYSLSGRAWRIQIPASSTIRGHAGVNNLLEFVGMVVNIWLECLDSNDNQVCILAVGDNTSAIGWLFKSSKLDPTSPSHMAHLLAARHLATLLMNHGCCIASQHIKGELNVVADLLSFVGEDDRGKHHPLAHDHPPNDVLTQRFHDHLPSQVPESFAISQLPNEILSWVTLVLQTMESSLIAAKKGGTKTQTGFGGDGQGSADGQATRLTPSSLCYPTTSENSWCDRSSSAIAMPSGKPMVTLMETVRGRWWRALSAKPQATWLRRFGAISGRAPCTSRAALTYCPSSGPSLKPSQTKTPPSTSSGRLPQS